MNDYFGFGSSDDAPPPPNRAQRRAMAKEDRREAKAATKRWNARKRGTQS